MSSQANATGPGNAALEGLTVETRRLFYLQFALTLVVGAVCAVMAGTLEGIAGAFGGAIALVNGWLMGRSVRRATEMARRQPGAETMALLFGALQRFAFVAAAFATGMGGYGLPPVQVIVGFAVVHGVFFLARAFVAPGPAGKERAH